MSALPKIKIKLPSGDADEYICELYQAQTILNFNEGIFLVEGKGIQSFEELARIANEAKYRDKEFLEVVLLQTMDGG